jgi:hypothetical protein
VPPFRIIGGIHVKINDFKLTFAPILMSLPKEIGGGNGVCGPGFECIPGAAAEH